MTAPPTQQFPEDEQLDACIERLDAALNKVYEKAEAVAESKSPTPTSAFSPGRFKQTKEALVILHEKAIKEDEQQVQCDTRFLRKA